MRKKLVWIVAILLVVMLLAPAASAQDQTVDVIHPFSGIKHFVVRVYTIKIAHSDTLHIPSEVR